VSTEIKTFTNIALKTAR